MLVEPRSINPPLLDATLPRIMLPHRSVVSQLQAAGYRFTGMETIGERDNFQLQAMYVGHWREAEREKTANHSGHPH